MCGSPTLHVFSLISPPNRHCAKNQIRVILISDLVITSLFYPALAIYFSSQPLSHFSARLFDSFSGSDSHAAVYRTDLREIWETIDGVRLREDSAAQARCGAERTIRLERVLLPSVQPDDPFGSLNKATLLGALQLQHRIQDTLAASSNDVLDYVTEPDGGGIFVLGPLMHWHENDEELSLDPNVIRTINTSRNVTKAGIPISNDLTLAGRSVVDDKALIYEAEFLVLTYFFVESDCHANVKHSAWLQVLNDAASGLGVVTKSTAQPKLIALQVNSLCSSLLIHIV